MKNPLPPFPVAFLLLTTSLLGNIENWLYRLAWPRGRFLPDPKVPVKWSLNENLVWKTPIPGKGHASPIV